MTSKDPTIKIGNLSNWLGIILFPLSCLQPCQLINLKNAKNWMYCKFSLSQDYRFHIKPIAGKAEKRPEGKEIPQDEKAGVPLLNLSNKPPL